MLTPQEVSERAFPKASFGGYQMSHVDEFLDLLTADYTALYSENAVLKSKMKVLVEKVEEYRATEEAMRKALMTAQRMADEMVQSAERRRDDILRSAEAEAQAQVAGLQQEIRSEEFRLTSAQRETAQFIQRVRTLHEQNQRFLEQLGELAPAPATPPPEDEVNQAASEIDDNVQRLLAQAMVEATTENLKAKVEQEPKDLSDTAEFPALDTDDEENDLPFLSAAGPARPVAQDAGDTQRIDFGSLQFGRDYEIK